MVYMQVKPINTCSPVLLALLTLYIIILQTFSRHKYFKCFPSVQCRSVSTWRVDSLSLALCKIIDCCMSLLGTNIPIKAALDFGAFYVSYDRNTVAQLKSQPPSGFQSNYRVLR